MGRGSDFHGTERKVGQILWVKDLDQDLFQDLVQDLDHSLEQYFNWALDQDPFHELSKSWSKTYTTA